MQRNLLLILMFMIVLSPLAIDIYLPSIPTMATEFSVHISQVQSTLTLFLFAMGLGQILIGPLTDKFGRRPIALFGVILYCASSVLASTVTAFYWLQIARVLQGLAACSISIVVFSAVRDSYSHKESAKIYSYLNGAICVIPALAPTLGGLLALEFGWRSNFIFMACYSLLILLIVGYRLPETRPSKTVTTGALYRWGRYQPILSNRHFLFYAITCMTSMAAILTYVSYAPVWLISQLGVSELTFSGLFALNAAVNIIACFTGPLVINKLGNRTTVLFSLFLLLLSALLLLAGQQVAPATGLVAAAAFMLPITFLCAGFAFLLGPATSMALSAFGERAGTAAALLGFIQMSGASILSGLIQQTQLSAPYAVALILGIFPLGLIFIMALNRFSHWHQEPCRVDC